MQHVVLGATRYEGIAQLLRLAEFKFSEARRQGVSPCTSVSSPPSLVHGSANEIKLKQMLFKLCQT